MTTQREREKQLNVCVGDMQGWLGLNTNIPAVTTTTTTLQLFHSHGQELRLRSGGKKEDPDLPLYISTTVSISVIRFLINFLAPPVRPAHPGESGELDWTQLRSGLELGQFMD